MDKSKIERKLAKKIRHIIKKIESGYDTVYSYTDGCDEYGFIRFFECKNGYNGESWEVNEERDNSIINRKLNIINNGIIFNGVKYYIDSDLYYKEYYDKELVKIISEKEHDKLLEISKIIKYIISSMKNQIEEYDKEKDRSTINFMLQRDAFYNAKKKLNYTPLHNFKDFVKYLKNNNYLRSSQLLLDIINSKKFKNERKILGLGTELIK